jgi:type VI secretion system protein ImpL
MLPSFLIRIMRSGIFLTLIFGLILSVVVFFFAGFLGTDDWRPFDSLTSRIIVISIIWVLIVLTFLIRWLLRRRRNRKLTEDIAGKEAEVDPQGEYVKGEVAEVGVKLKEALGTLRKSKLGRKSLYELPWYIMIGPPGAGKTTAIVNSGLQFPLVGEGGAASVRGVGGTRNCDWWFTNDAVLIDTAGRYTLQDSDQSADSAAWLGFLDLLKKRRRRQPINGAIVAISLADLSMQDQTTQAEHARAVRRRLNELRERLGLRFPVYVIFTKADLVAGFSEFFDSLGKEDRYQVWGHTFDKLAVAGDSEDPIGGFDNAFAGLLAQINVQLLERMQAETDVQRRALIAGFPNQFATLRQIARDFLTEMFQTSRYDDRHLLRGFYFASGTQEGTPIDRLMMSMARTFGIGRQAIGTGRGTGRAFFLKRLFEDVIFRESGLVSANDRVERRYKVMKWGSVAASVLIALTLAFLWTRSYLGNSQLIADVSESARIYQASAADIPSKPVSDSDVASTVTALNILRDAPLNPTLRRPEIPDGVGWGLYQGDVLGTQIAQTYRAGLNEFFLPRLLVRLEEQMQESIGSPGELYDALKIYMMLGNLGGDETGHDFVRDWFTRDWNASFKGAARAPLREDLELHLEALLDAPLQPPELNGDLIERVQSTLADLPLARRVYSGILKSPEATALQKWRLTDVGGADLEKVIVRSSGKPLSEGIDGIYTYAGFNDVFLPKTLSVARQVQIENWVLGRYGEEEINDNALVLLARDVLNLYYNDFVDQYSQILSEIDIIPLENAQHAVDVTFTLSGATSPVEKIFAAVAEETRLTEERELISTENLGADAAALAQSEARTSLDFRSRFILEQIISLDTESGRPEKPPGQFVEDRFTWLHRLMDPPQEGELSRMDKIIDTIRDVNQELTRMLTTDSGFSTGNGTGESAIKRLQVEVASLDGPLKRWADQIASGSSGITSEGTRGALNAKWQGRVFGKCQEVVDDRFPFSPQSRSDAPLSAFNALFAPGGDIETFFSENLLKYVDTRQRPWAWNPGSGTDLGISNEVLQQFEFADQIKRTFFANGVSPSVGFQVQPYASGEKVDEALLMIDGQEILYKKGQGSSPFAIAWPGPVGAASVSFSPRAINRENSISRDGPWAFFRLLRTAQIRTIPGSDQLSVNFEVGGRFAVFRIRADAILNPLTLPALTKFRCPNSL